MVYEDLAAIPTVTSDLALVPYRELINLQNLFSTNPLDSTSNLGGQAKATHTPAADQKLGEQKLVHGSSHSNTAESSPGARNRSKTQQSRLSERHAYERQISDLNRQLAEREERLRRATAEAVRARRELERTRSDLKHKESALRRLIQK